MAQPRSFNEIFPGDSAMAELMRAHDWAATPLGAAEHWPDALKVPLRMMLTSRFEMWLGWGPDLSFFYNDAYVPTLGIKHPAALGKPMREVWREVFANVEDRIASVMRDGIATWDQALLLLLERSGAPEETYHTFSYSPLHGAGGRVEGLMCVVTEETGRVINERRLATLRTLASALLPVRSPATLIAATLAALRTNDKDFPFAAVRLFDAPPDDPIAAADWPIDRVTADGGPIQLQLEGILAQPPQGAWSTAPRDGLLVPLIKPSQTRPAGALILGLNPFRSSADRIADFATLIAAQISGALGVIDAHLREAAEIARLQSLFEQSPSFMAILRGPEHRFELMNPGYLQVVGHRDLIGRPVREALSDLEGQGFFELLDRVYQTGEPYAGRSVPITLQKQPGADPQNGFLDFVYQPIRDADGTITGIFVEGFDVTESQVAAQALVESEAQFRTLTEAMVNQAWTARPDGHLNWFNARVYEYSGAAPTELDGTRWAEIVHPDDLGVAMERWERSLRSGEPYETEFRLRNAAGDYRWHIARAVPQRGEHDAIIQWIGTNTDIHEQKATAHALAELNATLEEQVQQRTGELMAVEEALRQSQKMEAVGQLTGGIAHDFNNLLAVVTGNIELLQRRIEQGALDAAPRHIAAAQNATRRAASLTQRLLAFSRRQTLEPKPVDTNRLAAEMSALIRQTIGPAIEMEVVGAGGLWTVRVDPNQLENALLNLCINARDAMPDGGRLTIETANKWLDDRAARERDLAPGQYVSLCVTDTGTGMPPETVARAFDPFFTTKPIGQGTGLGLSMIYGFVRQSDGQVRIYSEQGKGTTVCLYFPRYVGEGVVDEERAAAPEANFDGHGETVLVVDDEDGVRALIADVLTSAGYRVLEADDGAAGLKYLQSDTRIDLLITDVGLPGGMNGRQVADAGRALRPDLKVLFITGYAENAAFGNGHLERGMQILTKPFSIEPLGTKVREILDS